VDCADHPPSGLAVTSAALFAGCATGLAMVLATDGRSMARRRLRHVRSPPRGSATGSPAGTRGSPAAVAGRGAFAASGVAVGAVVLMLGWAPVLFGAAPAAMVVTGRQLRDRAVARRSASLCAAQLPRAADLIAACLDAGAAPADALDIVRAQVGDPLATRLAPAAGALRAGADPMLAYGGGHVDGTSWGRSRQARDLDDPARRLVRALARAMDSGAPVASTVAAVADDQRRQQRWAAEASARRAGVLAVGPLVACFLPAFVLLGVVPVVLGIAGDVLGGLS
jgi:type II secretion system (T2SS) protein F